MPAAVPRDYRYPDDGDILTAAMIEDSAVAQELWGEQESEILQLFEAELRGLSPRRYLLDYGSGEGRITERFASLFERITSFEADPQRAERQARLLAHSPYAEHIDVFSDLGEVDALGVEYDAVVCSHVLQHVATDIANGILEYLARALRAGGSALITTSVYRWDRELFTVSSFGSDGRNVEKEVAPAEFDRVFTSNEQGLLPIHFFACTGLVELIASHGLEPSAAYAFHGGAGIRGPLALSDEDGDERVRDLADCRDIAILARKV
jgi:SAM-dependent methyltransferase